MSVLYPSQYILQFTDTDDTSCRSQFFWYPLGIITFYSFILNTDITTPQLLKPLGLNAVSSTDWPDLSLQQIHECSRTKMNVNLELLNF